MTELSPAAQAVFNAYLDNCDGAYNKEWYKGDLVMIAAALRAAADQLGKCRAPGAEFEDLYPRIIEVDDLLAIADELEAL